MKLSTFKTTALIALIAQGALMLGGVIIATFAPGLAIANFFMNWFSVAIISLAANALLNVALHFLVKAEPGANPILKKEQKPALKIYDNNDDKNLNYATYEIERKIDNYYKRIHQEYPKIRNTLSAKIRASADTLIYGLHDLHVHRERHLKSLHQNLNLTYIHPIGNAPRLDPRINRDDLVIYFHGEFYRKTTKEALNAHTLRAKDAFTTLQLNVSETLTYAMDKDILKATLNLLPHGKVCIDGFITDFVNKAQYSFNDRYKFSDIIEMALNEYRDCIQNHFMKNQIFDDEFLDCKSFNELSDKITKLNPKYNKNYDIGVVNDAIVDFLFDVISDEIKGNIIQSEHEYAQNYTKENIRNYLENLIMFTHVHENEGPVPDAQLMDCASELVKKRLQNPTSKAKPDLW